MPFAYYNDNDPDSVLWLRSLIAKGLIADGEVDSRSILDVSADDLKSFTQCHFFSGIGGWSYALRLAGWPDDKPVWTGSPPCFPAGVLITTKRGHLPIEEVVVGDLCLTHSGKWRPVVRVGNANKSTVTLTGHGHFGLQTTPEHPFFAKTRRIFSTREKGLGVRKHVVGERFWNPAKNMAGVWWAMAKNFPGIEQPTYPKGYSDEELGFLCGLYVGDGWVSKGNQSERLILGVSESKAAEIVAALPKVLFSKHKARTGVRLLVNDTALGVFLRNSFGEGSKTKTLPIWLFDCPETIKSFFIKGWDLTDGTRKLNAGSRRITTTSRKLAVLGRMLLVSMGFSASIRKVLTPEFTVIEGRVVNQADYYVLNRSNNPRYTFADNLHHWFKVKSVKNDSNPSLVYDLEIAEDHSYLADGIVVHNCQPFSAAGLQKGQDDARHLAPHFAELIAAGRPEFVFGEQVASAAVFGPANTPKSRVAEEPEWAWIDDLRLRLEAARYAVGAGDIPAASVGAPHIRQRTFFGAVRLADADDTRLEGWREPERGCAAERFVGASGLALRLADADGGDSCAERPQRGGQQRQFPQGLGVGGLAAACRGPVPQRGPDQRDGDAATFEWLGDSELHGSRSPLGAKVGGSEGTWERGGLLQSQRPDSPFEWLGDSVHGRRQFEQIQFASDGERVGKSGREQVQPSQNDLCSSERLADDKRQQWREIGVLGLREVQSESGVGATAESPRSCCDRLASPTNGFWRDADWIFCRDGKWRPIEPSDVPLADGVSEGMGRSLSSPLVKSEAFKVGSGHAYEGKSRSAMLRGYGNAIVPQAAAIFIAAFMESLADDSDDLL